MTRVALYHHTNVVLLTCAKGSCEKKVLNRFCPKKGGIWKNVEKNYIGIFGFLEGSVKTDLFQCKFTLCNFIFYSFLSVVYGLLASDMTFWLFLAKIWLGAAEVERRGREGSSDRRRESCRRMDHSVKAMQGHRKVAFSRLFNRHRFENGELECLFRRYILRVQAAHANIASFLCSIYRNTSHPSYIMYLVRGFCFVLLCFFLKLSSLALYSLPSMFMLCHQHTSITSSVALFVVLTAALATASFVQVQAPTLPNLYHSFHCGVFVILFIVLCTRSIEDLYLNYVCYTIIAFCTAFCVVSLPGMTPAVD